jgi:predicted nucleotidyltransferase
MRDEIYRLFQFTLENPKILGVLLYGSYVNNQAHSLSDIDICIVVPGENNYGMYKYIMHNFKGDYDKYEIRFFEELPLHIQGQIIDSGIVIISPDMPALYEYFYHFREDWIDLQYQLKNCI